MNDDHKLAEPGHADAPSGQRLRAKMEAIWGPRWRKHAPAALGATPSTLDRQVNGHVGVNPTLSILVDRLLSDREYKRRLSESAIRAKPHMAAKREPMNLEALSDDARYVAHLFAPLRPGRSLTVEDPAMFTERGRNAMDELVAEGVIQADGMESGGVAYRALMSTRRARSWVKKTRHHGFDIFGYGEHGAWTSTTSSV